MPVRGVDLSNILTPTPQRLGGMGGIPAAVRGVVKQQSQDERSEAERQLRREQEQRLMRGQDLNQQFRAQQMQAQQRQFAAQQMAAEAQAQEKRQDEAVHGVLGALSKENVNPVELGARIENLRRLGFNVEQIADEETAGQESQMETAPGVSPPGTSSPQRPKGRVAGPGYSALEQPGDGAPRPEPARVTQIGQAGPPGAPGLESELEDPWAGSLPPEDTQKESLSPSAAKGTPSPTGGGRLNVRGMRVTDAQGNRVFELPFDGLGANKQGVLDALGQLGAHARTPEESRAGHLALTMGNDLITAGRPQGEAFREAKKAYDYELGRLGKVRQFGGGGVPLDGELSKKDKDKRFDQIFRLTSRDTRLQNLQKLNQQLIDSETATKNLSGKGGFAQLNGFVHTIKEAQGGRVTDNDMKQAYGAAMSKIAQLQHVYNQYATTDVPMPPEAIENIREAQKLTEEYMRVAQRKTAIHVARSASSSPDIKFADDADRARMGAWVANDLLPGSDISPEEFSRTVTTDGAPGKGAQQKSTKQRVDDLLNKQ